jgi:hypothetical protein
MAKPFLDLLKKELSFEWKEEQQKAFEDLKEKFSFAPMLKFPPSCSKFTPMQVTLLLMGSS